MNHTKLFGIFVMILLAVTSIFAAPITGNITDSATRNALSGARVEITNSATHAVLDWTTTASNGLYTAESVTTGLKTINISATGFNSFVITRFVPVAGLTNQNFALGPIKAYVVSGTETSSIPGQSGVTIQLKQGTTTIYQTTTDGTGAYSLTALNGTYTFQATKAGFATFTDSVTVAGADVPLHNFALTGAVTAATLNGYVRNSTGASLQSAIVRLTRTGGTVADNQTSATGLYSLGTVAGTYNATASLAGFNDQTKPIALSAGATTNLDFSLTPIGTTCTENWVCGNWGTCSGGSQSRTCTDLNSCGTTANRPALTQSCTITPPSNPTGGKPSGTSSQTPLPTDIFVMPQSFIWDLTKGDSYTKSIKQTESIVFEYEGTSYSLNVADLDADGKMTFKISPTSESKTGYKGDEMTFTIKDKELVVSVSEILYNANILSQSALKVKMTLKEGKKPVSIPKVAEKVADGIIKVAGEIAPPKGTPVPVGIGISIGTILVGLLMFLGIRKIWV